MTAAKLGRCTAAANLLTAAATIIVASSGPHASSQPAPAPAAITTQDGGNFLPAYLNTIRGANPRPGDACQPNLLAPCDTP